MNGGLRQDLSDIQEAVVVNASAKTFTVILEFDLATPLLLLQNLLDNAGQSPTFDTRKALAAFSSSAMSLMVL